MITKDELVEIKKKRNTNLYYAEKEYLQHIFLYALSQKYPDDFVFKGGTCLKICYGLERASEDLDFGTQLSIPKIKKAVEECLEYFNRLNIKYEIYDEKEYEGNYRIEARFQAVLYNGSPQSTNTLKIDFNKNKPFYPAVKVISLLFSDVPPFALRVLEEKEILAEKVRALATRRQARDLYDCWMLLQNKIPLDKLLLMKKFKEEHIPQKQLKPLALVSKVEYERDLKPLVRILPSYEQVAKDVNAALRIALHKMAKKASKIRSTIKEDIDWGLHGR